MTFSFELWAGEPALYTSRGTRYDVDDVEGVMSELLSDYNTEYITVFVHGRGKHPEKGLTIIPDIEERYGVKTIMFTWPSWESAVERPVHSGINSADEMLIFLTKLNEYIRNNPHKAARFKLTLLVHSMGNIVFKKMMDDLYQGDFKWDLFSNVILNSADVPSKKHSEWVEKIDFGKSLYITNNDDDSVLFGSELLDSFNGDYDDYEGPRLGKDLAKDFKKKGVVKSQNAIYLDLSKLSYGGHRHYLMKDKSKYNFQKNIFTSLLHGEKPRLDRSAGVYKVRGNVYHFKR
ncbi:hypothetical protein A9Q84_09655 [Halobacteriovorax marinus]|uniref:Alpha/beta hydrolase n=1 Tax=Halobacteriovorax marinus TaxID=97084 RepID=A0A1Y5FAU4_9BACT|nr:hypothetical protein A9Q84_09655 [Halobacteriovorax marinus]